MGRFITPDPEAGANPFGEMVKLAVAAQERSLTVAQNWSDALLATLKEQTEDSRANPATLASTLGAIERALVSQEETNRTIRQSWRATARSWTASTPPRSAAPGLCRPP